MLAGLRFHYGRWRSVRAAARGLRPASADEWARIDALREACRTLPGKKRADRTPNEADCASAMNRLRHLALHADPRAFRRWDVIVERMAVRHSPVTPIELAALQARADWESRWRRAIRACEGGGRTRIRAGPRAASR